MRLRIERSGEIRCLYAEAINLDALGAVSIRRASHVEPDAAGRWWADMAPLGGPRLEPFPCRSEALRAENAWIDAYLIDRAPSSTPATDDADDRPGREQS
jgi:hypothetical protein